MKCLLCDYITTDKKSLKEHYIEFHNVNKNNYFFKRLIDFKGNTFYQRQCQFCKEFVYENKVEHDFLKHYNDANIQSGGAAAAAAGYDDDDDDDDDDGNGSLKKPINIIDKQSIRKIEITFKEHSTFYDFFDSVAVVDNFLNQVKNVFQRYENDVLLRAGFSIENVQRPLDNYSEPLVQTRYWSTEPIQTKSFNDFVLFKTRESILKRVINNRLSGSAWSFNKFNYLNVKILKVSNSLMK